MKTSSKILYHLVFFTTLSIVVFSLFAIIFPSFLMTTFYPYTTNLQPFESSVWLVPIVSSNSILLVIGFAYYRKRLPLQIYKGIEFVLNFEISKKTALLTGIIILVFYIGFSLPELAIDEATQWDDYHLLKSGLDIWPSTEDGIIQYSPYSNEGYSEYERPIRMLLLDTSLDIFQNVKILPFVASILLVVVTFFLTYQITQKRFAGIISMVILLQSHTFLHFDTIATYENFWVLFYVVSLYAINRKWQYSSMSFLLSIFTKAFIWVFFLPSLYYICRASISTRKKLYTLASYAASLIVILLVLSFGESIYFDIINFSPSEFFLAFNALGFALRYDLIIVLSLLPLTLGLFFKFRKENSKKADSILVLILTALLAGPVVSMLTDFYSVMPYRFLPLIVFVAVGIGVLLSRKN
tara:strand:- start:538 stop:1770 length:1233 start_codon:yes stop_codon:yes gene_type:complete